MTKIEWTDETINPIIGCSKISPGCRNCYAERMAKRQKAMKTRGYEEVVDRNGWTGKTAFVPSELEKPYRWKKPKKIFVDSMSDIFHPSVKIEWIVDIFAMMAKSRRHTFQLLTKRVGRMASVLDGDLSGEFVARFRKKYSHNNPVLIMDKNVWLGATITNQNEADSILPTFLKFRTCNIRFVSIEPMLGMIDMGKFLRPSWGELQDCRWGGKSRPYLVALDWVICGGESGPGARPVNPDWVRDLRDQCQSVGVPFFFKGWGNHCAPSQMTPETYLQWDVGHAGECNDDDPQPMNKNLAGRELDGREHNEFPK